jgi:hypothetical protein
VSIHLLASLETVCVDGFDGHSTVLSALAMAFSHTAFTSFHFASGLEAISDGCFCRCENLSSVTCDFDLTLIRIGSEAFARTGLTSIHLPICLKSSSGWCFRIVSRSPLLRLRPIANCHELRTVATISYVTFDIEAKLVRI